MQLFHGRFRRQSGQAIVLIALLLVALFGFLGLAVDGGRLYVERREQQVAADSAALATADSFVLTQDMSAAMQAGATVYAANTRITGTPSATWCTSPPLGTPSPWTSCTATVTWSGDPHVLTLKFVDYRNQAKGLEFWATSSSSIGLAFMQVLGAGPAVTIGATAATVTYDLSETPAILTLGRAPCNGSSGTSLTVSGSNGLNVTVVGDVFSDGGIGVSTGATVNVAGNAYENCGGLPMSGIDNTGFNQYSPIAPITNSFNGGSQYPWASNYTTVSRTWPSANGPVEVFPGTYNANPQLSSAACYFLDGGQYFYPGGFTVNGGLISNDLRSPDEPWWKDITQRAGAAGTDDVQLWRLNSLSCDGSFSANNVTSTGGGGHPLFSGGGGGGQLSLVVTAGRQDVFYPGGGPAVTYVRESSPSMCRTINLGGHDGFQVSVSNVPGAQWYNVYALAAGCSSTTSTSQFGYIGSFCNGQAAVQGCTQSITMSNSKTNGCPNVPAWNAQTPLTPGPNANTGTCSLGYVVSPIYDSTNVPTPMSTSPTSPRQATCNAPATPLAGASIAQGCPAPDPSACPSGVVGQALGCITGEPNGPPGRNTPYTGDVADENYCANNSGAWAACGGSNYSVTPGGVQFDFTNASGSCLSQGGSGGAWVFGGKQYDWIAIYSDNSTCGGANPNKVVGGSSTSYVGTIYMPGTSITLSGGGQSAIANQVIANQVTIDGSSGVTVAFNPNYSPTPPAGRLVDQAPR